MSDSERSSEQTRTQAGVPEIGVVDDSRAIFLAWKLCMKESALVHYFNSPEALYQAIERAPELLERLAVLIIDQRFPGSRHSGVSLATMLQRKAPRPRLVLSSRGVFSPEELSCFDASIDKSPIPLQELLSSTRPGAKP